MSTLICPAIWLIGGGSVLLLLRVRQQRYAEQLVLDWLTQNRSELVGTRIRRNRWGPFAAIQVPPQLFFFHIQFRDSNGALKNAYVAAGRRGWLGLGDNFVRVEPDDGKGGYFLG
ncbi:MAG TPA: hypothetical protein VF624_11680 [Tepidisphaeraceae bacterium]|jgi:hypothetical protein